MRKDENDEDGTPDVSGIVDALRPLCEEIARLNAQARELGLFVNDRPLLECPHCRLVEDVTVEGFLIVYAATDYDMDATPVTPASDTGRHFADLSEGQFLCPACGTVFTPPEEDEPEWWSDDADRRPK
ncbi:MAG: hypothetical protein SFU56_19360 [Capsulimonadales bacterium]|nr:hypothetical protein [Capsulimonadales bacterium]